MIAKIPLCRTGTKTAPVFDTIPIEVYLTNSHRTNGDNSARHVAAGRFVNRPYDDTDGMGYKRRAFFFRKCSIWSLCHY